MLLYFMYCLFILVTPKTNFMPDVTIKFILIISLIPILKQARPCLKTCCLFVVYLFGLNSFKLRKLLGSRPTVSSLVLYNQHTQTCPNPEFSDVLAFDANKYLLQTGNYCLVIKQHLALRSLSSLGSNKGAEKRKHDTQ